MDKWERKDDPDVVVIAILLNEENAEMVSRWCDGILVSEIDPEHPEEHQPGINVPTALGMRRASLGQYVVKGGDKFLVVDIRPFEEKYKPVGKDSPPPESNGDSMRRQGFGENISSAKMI